MRDRYTCQYCHRVMPSGELTLDHVIPALARRRNGVGKPGGLLPSLQ